jgi:alpha-glucosidase
MHATGSVTAWLGATCSAFDAVVGIDDEVLETPGESGIGSVRFRVYGDDVLLAETSVLTNDDAAFPLHVDVAGVKRLRLVADEATNGKNFDHADWADAKVTCSAG